MSGTRKHSAYFRRVVLFLVICMQASGFSQTQQSGQPPAAEPAPASDSVPATDQSETKKQKRSEKRGSFVGAPIPMSSPAIGSGVTIMAGYIFSLSKKDAISPPSVVGGAALFTNNGTKGFAVGTQLYFKEDRYHLLTGYVSADLNYSFYGTGTAAGDRGVKFELKQTLGLFFAEGTRRLFWRIFAGPRIIAGTSTLAPQHLGEQNSELPPLNVGFNLRSLGLKIERDTTTNRFYPVDGMMGHFSADFFDDALGSNFTFQSYRLTVNAYQGLTKNQVLAYNTYICATGGAAPFFGQCIFGTNNQLRGYPAGRYIDRDLLAMQVEYRLSLPRRFGVAAFAGLGEVGPSFGGFNYDGLLPSVGFGPRFQVSTKYHVNLRADFAQGKNDRTFSMGIGEAF
jgi:outer membrane protein assembly factor BamA